MVRWSDGITDSVDTNLSKLREKEMANPSQCPCPENSTDRGAWPATVQGLQSQTRPSDQRSAAGAQGVGTAHGSRSRGGCESGQTMGEHWDCTNAGNTVFLQVDSAAAAPRPVTRCGHGV